MPNDCSNYLELTHGDPLAIDKVDTGLQQENLLRSFIPDSGKALTNIQNWGTKREAYNFTYERRNANCLYVEFCTANDPPTAFYHHLNAQSYQIRATFVEPGYNMVGYWGETSKDMIILDWYDDEIPDNLKKSFSLHFEDSDDCE
jgi:hypothetical protein